jgi:hypothetical protein
MHVLLVAKSAHVRVQSQCARRQTKMGQCHTLNARILHKEIAKHRQVESKLYRGEMHRQASTYTIPVILFSHQFFL